MFRFRPRPIVKNGRLLKVMRLKVEMNVLGEWEYAGSVKWNGRLWVSQDVALQDAMMRARYFLNGETS